MATDVKVKTAPKVVLAAIIVGGLVFGGNWYLKNHGAVQQQSKVSKVQGDLQGFEAAEDPANAATAALGSIPLPTEKPARINAPKVKMLVIPWNAINGVFLANGGPVTMEGSLMQKNGVNLVLERQDDYVKMRESLVACANELKNGAKVCATGANFVVIMGDAGPYFMKGLNEALVQIGSEYKAEIFGGTGRSYGEDKFMVPPAVKADAKQMAGLLVAGVVMDGDWNIALYHARANGICNNPDPKTYNPDCLNWVPTIMFTEADDKYIQGYCEDRMVVKNDPKTGETKRTGETKNVCVNAVVTWTPGDVAIAEKKGGLVSALSTRENDSQMAVAIVGLKGWNARNRATVEGILAAGLEAGDQIKRGGGTVLMRASAATAKVLGEGDAKYWTKYYRGAPETDAQGNEITLGGSQAFNLATAARYFGLEVGASNAYADAYTLFGKIMSEQYPADLPNFPAVSEILNTTYLQAVLDKAGSEKGTVTEVAFEEGTATGEQIAKRAWNITFQSGKATFTPDAYKVLDELAVELVVAGNTIPEVHGHTDNTGTPNGNMVLSEQRAAAVKQYLEQKAPANFPAGRVKVIAHGQTTPVDSNDSEAGRARNRRVEIILKSNR